MYVHTKNITTPHSRMMLKFLCR